MWWVGGPERPGGPHDGTGRGEWPNELEDHNGVHGRAGA